MRLLDTSTLEVEVFIQRRVSEYAILSHTWEDEEKKGFAKIERCCQMAAEDGYSYCWIDTCCIDKESSAKLSEAINSMYQWYRDSNVCYVKSKWFTRSWTLQELIPPLVVEFYCADWTECGTRLSLQAHIADITKVIPAVLQGGDPSRCTDEAYCLLGLFRINMPLLYGEGSKAFRRLQEAIMREEEDYTLLTWTSARLNSSSEGYLRTHRATSLR
ncbi:hypothetical protein CC86DRAFT_446586 [Ophiobolus disseminans]|uniref:Uncharacterized protein n=1 Tax=Ophiobolus disseminans TaxID=1469910 RepID=A0A6A6ZX73_9PLEO|nr:hypothetical protein CC86DRAFT_446586 [Ophiobolus disseminans]